MDLERKAIDRIKMASEMSQKYYGKPLVCTYSGGKRRYKEFADFPTYKRAYIRAFEKMLEGVTTKYWKSGEDVFRWWMEDKNTEGQLAFNQEGYITEDYI